MKTELPSRTAGETTLPSGAKVWMQTLNDLARDEVRHAANNAARLAVQPYRKGGEFYSLYLADCKAMSPQEQGTWIVRRVIASGVINDKLTELFSPLPPVERGELTEEAYLAAYEEWEQKTSAQATQRAEKETELIEAEFKKAIELSTRERQARCLDAMIAHEFTSAFGIRWLHETLWRAVRDVEDHHARHYICLQELVDLSDADRAHLEAFYDELDGISPAQIPT